MCVKTRKNLTKGATNLENFYGCGEWKGEPNFPDFFRGNQPIRTISLSLSLLPHLTSSTTHLWSHLSGVSVPMYLEVKAVCPFLHLVVGGMPLLVSSPLGSDLIPEVMAGGALSLLVGLLLLEFSIFWGHIILYFLPSFVLLPVS